jgi:hypothetical protein
VDVDCNLVIFLGIYILIVGLGDTDSPSGQSIFVRPGKTNLFPPSQPIRANGIAKCAKTGNSESAAFGPRINRGQVQERCKNWEEKAIFTTNVNLQPSFCFVLFLVILWLNPGPQVC